jgi:hypothetical protein
MTTLLVAFTVAAVLVCALICAEGLWRRHVFVWLPGYLRSRLNRETPSSGPVHVMFCFVDHFEPGWKRPDVDVESARVDRWCLGYPKLASRFKDADGRAPQHTFFFPEEEYREEHLDKLARLCAAGFGEIEVHLHHDNDTSDGLRVKLRRFVRVLHERHGALSVDPITRRVAWAFIHGNWSLDNSRPDGRWCGVNDELRVLAECGCFADFTLPSAPSDTQTATVNSIYYATDDPLRPKSHDRGVRVRVGTAPSGDLLIVQGVLGWDWSSRKFGLLPRIENSDIRAGQQPTRARVDRWVELAPTVHGRPEWKFVKVHTHGAPETQHDALLGSASAAMYEYLGSRYNDGRDFVLHYVSARELFNIVKAAEAGLTGDPGKYRDYLLPRPAFRSDIEKVAHYMSAP